MANVTVTYGGGKWSSNNYQVPLASSTVSFHSPDADCVICFENSQTFGTNTLNLTQGGADTDLTVQNRVATKFTPNTPPYDCSSGPIKLTGPTYNITMGGGVPGPKKPRPTRKAAVRKSAARKSSSRKKAGAKKKAGGKKKAAGKKKVGGKKKAARKRK